MSSIRVMILGVLNSDKKPHHGYEVRQELESWNADQWANIAYGSIYFSLKKMTEEGLLEVIRQEGEAEESPKTQYQITKRGEDAFMTLLRKQWWDYKAAIDPFQVALAFMNQMPREELLIALKHRADHLQLFITSMERMTPIMWQQNNDWPRHVQECFLLNGARIKAEVEWLNALTKKVQAGEMP